MLYDQLILIKPLLTLDSSTAGYELNHQNDNRDNQDQVDQPATEVSQKAKQPENQKNYQDCPKHTNSFFSGVTESQ